MPDAIPIGEEIWIRRDTTGRGGSILVRESAIFLLTLLAFVVVPLVAISLGFKVHYFANTSLGIKYGLNTPLVIVGLPIIAWSPLFLIVFLQWIKTIKLSRYCPVWFFAEQLNPERLTIYTFRKLPVSIELSKSRIIETSETNVFRSFISINITDETNHDSVKLGFLTPEEYNRFMQYWNAAQKPSDE